MVRRSLLFINMVCCPDGERGEMVQVFRRSVIKNELKRARMVHNGLEGGGRTQKTGIFTRWRVSFITFRLKRVFLLSILTATVSRSVWIGGPYSVLEPRSLGCFYVHRQIIRIKGVT
ncbi:MAG: hypothetical protein CSB48_04835 [Proteobacteria bacterium]|nr:MAG: hypothetical protein CSB48_04835 [Pseudomonadota bacterium]